MALGRLLIRFLVVPLGGCLAICVAMIFVMVAHWNRLAPLQADDPSGLMTFVMLGPMLAVAVGVMLWPATVGALLAEVFAIRSWIYHLANGAVSALLSLATIGGLDKPYDFSDEPLIVAGAGLAAGFTYWLVAGWSAGFWKPVFASPPRPAIPPPQA